MALYRSCICIFYLAKYSNRAGTSCLHGFMPEGRLPLRSCACVPDFVPENTSASQHQLMGAGELPIGGKEGQDGRVDA